MSDPKPRAVHKATIHARCPKGGWDYYEIMIEPPGFLLVEQIEIALDLVRGREAYQEDLTGELAQLLEARVTSRGRHGKTDTEVTAG